MEEPNWFDLGQRSFQCRILHEFAHQSHSPGWWMQAFNLTLIPRTEYHRTRKKKKKKLLQLDGSCINVTVAIHSMTVTISEWSICIICTDICWMWRWAMLYRNSDKNCYRVCIAYNKKVCRLYRYMLIVRSEKKAPTSKQDRWVPLHLRTCIGPK